MKGEIYLVFIILRENGANILDSVDLGHLQSSDISWFMTNFILYINCAV